jgi:hypothetical protein
MTEMAGYDRRNGFDRKFPVRAGYKIQEGGARDDRYEVPDKARI